MSWHLRFLGVGNAQAAPVLGSASAVIERDAAPLLMIDCGQEALDRYLHTYARLPEAIFITHTHMDHVAGLERLFFSAYFNPELRGKVRLYVPATVVAHMQTRLADYPGVLAEGGANWWDAFQLVPVSRGFWHLGQWFDVFPVRHHLPESAYGLRLPGSLFWSGDTRPIPEMLLKYAQSGELIAHDCSVHGNPSHAGIDDLEREYRPDWLARSVLYHYASHDDGKVLEQRGYRIARAGDCIALAAPEAYWGGGSPAG